MKPVLICLAAMLLASPCYSQADEKKGADEPRFFRLDFVVKELEGGKVINARAYSMTVSTQRGDQGQVRTGDKVPISTSKGELTYLDVGVAIECRSVRLVDNQLQFLVNADISNIPSEATAAGNPMIRQTRWGSSVMVPLRRAATIFSADTLSAKRQMQLEVTATPIP